MRIVRIPEYSDLRERFGPYIPEDATSVPTRSMLLAPPVGVECRCPDVILKFSDVVGVLVDIDRLVCRLNPRIAPSNSSLVTKPWPELISSLGTGALRYYRSLFQKAVDSRIEPVVIGSYRYDDTSVPDTLHLVSVDGGQLGVVSVGPYGVPVIRHGWAESVERFTLYRITGQPLS
ncbi:MAG: hypothetical protein HGA38_01010 [Candidatus Moranbacteria bacterium]|nr:hypothetical protein [Candidatus Moranbacteria bacterium]